jgi:hypothetical protein
VQRDALNWPTKPRRRAVWAVFDLATYSLSSRSAPGQDLGGQLRPTASTRGDGALVGGCGGWPMIGGPEARHGTAGGRDQWPYDCLRPGRSVRASMRLRLRHSGWTLSFGS